MQLSHPLVLISLFECFDDGVSCGRGLPDAMTLYIPEIRWYYTRSHTIENTDLNQWVCCWICSVLKMILIPNPITGADRLLCFCVCRNITPHSYLKVYHKDPNQVFNHNSRNNNGDARVSDLFTPLSHNRKPGQILMDWCVYISALVISLHEVGDGTRITIVSWSFFIMSSSCVFKNVQRKHV